jgi:flagellar basal-body rod protein FlgG
MINAMVSMNGLQQKLDLLADNIANANTVGYKRKEATFEDLLTNMKQQQQAFEQPVRLTPLGFNQGWGSRMVRVQPDLAQGPVQATESQYDVAIEGNALFEVATDAAGTRAYTRSGSFQIALDQDLVPFLATADGYAVIAQRPDGTEGRVDLPEGFSLRVNADGGALAVAKNGEVRDLGRIKLVQPIRPGVLSPTANNLFVVGDGMNVNDVVRTIVPNNVNNVRLMQGFLEQSNVTLADEMSDLMMVQRAYQMSARALTSSDTMMGLANNLRA